MKPVKTYILVANEDEARMCENDGVGKGVYEFTSITLEDSGVLHHKFADQPTSTQSEHGPTAGVEPRTSIRDADRHDFATYLADLVEGAFRTGEYDRLVVAAAPKVLGELRKALEGKVDIYADLDKDLVNTPIDDMAKHFEDVLAV